jgi:hypothetical protein
VHKLLCSSLQQCQADAPKEAEASPASAASAAANRPPSQKKPKTHWSGVERGALFSLLVSDLPGPNGTTVEVTVQLRRNSTDGFTESVEPGWSFKAKGACSSLLPTCPSAATHGLSLCLPQGRLIARMAAVAATTSTTSRWRPAVRQPLRARPWAPRCDPLTSQASSQSQPQLQGCRSQVKQLCRPQAQQHRRRANKQRRP